MYSSTFLSYSISSSTSCLPRLLSRGCSVSLTHSQPPTGVKMSSRRAATGPTRQCMHWKLVVTVMMGIIAGFGAIIGVIYLIQLLLRSIATFKTKFWKKLSLTLPAGKMSLEISLKVLKQERTSGSVHSVTEPGL